MATLHGKNSVLYMGDGTAVAVRISEAAEWSIDVDFEESPDPALGDSWTTRLKGLLDFSGAFSGNLDDAQDAVWDACLASTSVPFYLYPDSTVATRYYYGRIWPKLGVEGAVTDKESFAVSFVGDGQLAKNPA